MPEAFVSSARISNEVSRRVRGGRLRKLATRLYTRNFEDAPERIVLRNLWAIVAGYFPGALVADRTAVELRPAGDGSLCIVAPRGRDIKLPGVILRPRRGAPPQDDDRPFMGQHLFLSSTARAYLDNLVPSRGRGNRLPRTIPRSEIEEQLEKLLASAGNEALSRLRDDARRVAAALDRTRQHEELNRIIGALSGTQEARLTGRRARARARGQAYDAERIVMFEELFSTLQQTSAPTIRPPARDGVGSATLAFFEAYFSNYIEGTQFEVEEAANIVFRGQIPRQRPADAHDILGVWQIVSDASEIRRVPKTADELIDLLRSRHALVLGGRPEAFPGSFKTATNRVGGTVFVAPDAVLGTLMRGFDIHCGLDAGFHRAVFMHFLISEVHPFADGNGRLARIMMNAEFAAVNEERIVIPTVYRENYISAQRALSAGGAAVPLVRALDFAWRWTAAVRWTTLEDTVAELTTCNAFENEATAAAKGVRLAMPGKETQVEWGESKRFPSVNSSD